MRVTWSRLDRDPSSGLLTEAEQYRIRLVHTLIDAPPGEIRLDLRSYSHVDWCTMHQVKLDWISVHIATL